MYKLKPYQEEGVAFLLSAGRSHYLADDPGLGKTVQVAAALYKLACPPVVVICPANVVYGWYSHLKHVGYEPHIEGVTKGKAKTAIIVSYSRYIQNKFRDKYKAFFKDFQPYAVLDEAHYLKSPTASRTRKILGPHTLLIHATKIWLLSGTPITNRPIDLYCPLKAFRPDLISDTPTYQAFGIRYCAGYRDGFGWNFKGLSNAEDLKSKIDGWILRRELREVETQLPPVVLKTTYLDFPEFSPDTEHVSEERAQLAAAKGEAIAAYIRDTISSDKVVVFCYHTELIEYLRDQLKDYLPSVLYGKTPATKRRDVVDKFVSDENCQLFIGQIQAAGVGVDGLQHASNRIIYAEPDWSPAVFTQSLGRLRRIGQQKGTIFADVILASSTIDEGVFSSNIRKQNIINQLIQGEDIMVTSEEISKIFEAINTVGESAATVSVTFTFGASVEAAPEVKETVKKEQKKPAKKKAEEPVEEPEVAAEPELTKQNIHDLAYAFIGEGPDNVERFNIIKEQIFPKFGVTELNSIKPEDYAAFAGELAKGPDAFKGASEVKKLSL